MGFEHSLSREEMFARVVGRGELDFEQCVAAIRRMASDLENEPELGILLDMRETDYLANVPDLRRYAEMVNELESLRGHRIAIVVGSTAQYGMGRLFMAYHEMRGGSANVFRQIEPAMDWLSGSPQT